MLVPLPAPAMPECPVKAAAEQTKGVCVCVCVRVTSPHGRGSATVVILNEFRNGFLRDKSRFAFSLCII